MITIKQKKGEDRKEYLARVAVVFLENSWEIENEGLEIKYDDAVCDEYCLIDDIKNEYGF
jgi:hypothetical protein